jgi:hypothetical protein
MRKRAVLEVSELPIFEPELVEPIERLPADDKLGSLRAVLSPAVVTLLTAPIGPLSAIQAVPRDKTPEES